MTLFERIPGEPTPWRRWLLSSEAALAGTLLVAVVLASIPPQSTSIVREIPRSMLQPAQAVLLHGRTQARELAARFNDQSSTQADVQEQQAAIERLHSDGAVQSKPI